ncbi:hypothetical protein [Ruania albidiflava]|uniref:hypothetical protein n=1 Tax=Ruania albidiflava TaxID=366586 RepID=UPI0003B2F38A|nr:hypothetical protein [Ruania albidiflava]
MRGARGGRRRDRHPAPEAGWGSPEDSADPPVSPTGPGETSRRGYLGGAYPASPPPAEAPVTGPDPESADPYYQRPDYPTDPSGIPVPHPARDSAHSPE